MFLSPVAPAVFALPIIVAEGASSIGVPPWVELSAPVITGVFALGALLIKDWLEVRRRAGAEDDRERLIEQLRESLADARAGEAHLQLELDSLHRFRTGTSLTGDTAPTAGEASTQNELDSLHRFQQGIPLAGDIAPCAPAGSSADPGVADNGHLQHGADQRGPGGGA